MVTNTTSTPQHRPKYAATDPHGLAGRFLKRYGRDEHGHVALRYWRDEFWRFHQGQYQKITHSELQAKLTRFIREEFQRDKPTTKGGQILPVTRNLIGNVLLALTGDTLVESHLEQPVWTSQREPQAGPFFVFTNGMIATEDLITGRSARLRSHCSDWFTQAAFPYGYDATAKCPKWTNFLQDVLEGDDERTALLQQWFGYCLTPDTTQQRFVVAVGEGENGKSVVLDLLTAMLGPDNVSHVRAELFAQRFQLTMTLGKLANISYDTGAIDESAEATIKEFTGGDRMYFDRKGVPGIHAYPSARLILATNHDPRFADRSKGIWRRMIVIPFRVSVERNRQDPHLATKLKTELPGIFNWAVEGLRDLQRAGRFTMPKVCQEAWDEFRSESNPAREYLLDTYEQSAHDIEISCTDVYEEYRNWCGDRSLKALDATSFGKELRKTFRDIRRKREGTGGRRWKYQGLRRTTTLAGSPIIDSGGCGSTDTP